MSTPDTELLNQVAALARTRYQRIKAEADPAARVPTENELVKFCVFVYSTAIKLHNSVDQSNNRLTNRDILTLMDDYLSVASARQKQLGIEILLLFYDLNSLLEYYHLPIGANQSRTRFLQALSHNALTDAQARDSFASIRGDHAKVIKAVRHEMNNILNTCARENHRKLDPRFIGAIGSVNSFIRAAAITFVFYEQNNPQVPILLIFYIFGVLFWGDMISQLISRIPTSKKHSASSMFSSASVGALMFSALVLLQQDKLGRRVALEYGSYLGLPILHFLFLHIPPVYNFIEKKLFPIYEFFFPRIYPNRNIKRNLCDTGRVLGAYQSIAYVMPAAGIINVCGYAIYNEFWPFFFMQLGIIIITQVIYFSSFYFAIPKYAERADKSMLLAQYGIDPRISIRHNQSLKDIQAELVWIIIFSYLFLRFFVNLDLAVSANGGSAWARMLVGISAGLVAVIFSPPIGTILKNEIFARIIAPKSINREDVLYLQSHQDTLGYAQQSRDVMSNLLDKNEKYPQSLSERIQQVSLGAQTEDMDIGFGDFSVLFSILMLQVMTMSSYYIIEILLFNLLKDTDHHRGSYRYVFIELAVNIVLVFSVIFVLIFSLKQPKVPLFVVEIYGLPTRFARAFIEVCKTSDAKKTWEAFKKHTFIKPYPEYHQDLCKLMKRVVTDGGQAVPRLQAPVIRSFPAYELQAPEEPIPFVNVTPGSPMYRIL